MKSILCALLLSMLLWGYATAASTEVLQSWVGHDVNELIHSWGPPTNVYELPDGSKMYTWRFDGGKVAVPIGDVAIAVNRYCKTTFTVSKQGKILSWRWEGNAC